MFSFTTFAVLATAATTTVAQDPNPPLGGSDCRIQNQGGFNFAQVVLRTVINYDDICLSFQNNMNAVCTGTVVTCERDINSPQLKYFFFESHQDDCSAGDVEEVIKLSTDEEFPTCNVTG